jgi:hypothetical protein
MMEARKKHDTHTDRSLRESRPGPLRPGHLAIGALTACFLVTGAAGAQDTTVYRCTGENGSVELSQFPCPAGMENEEITVTDRETGWVPPSPGSSTNEKRSARSKRSGSGQTQAQKAAVDARRADKCWDKRRLLDEVNWKLRHGYRPVEGIKLRRKRQSYEDYLDRYCTEY